MTSPPEKCVVSIDLQLPEPDNYDSSTGDWSNMKYLTMTRKEGLRIFLDQEQDTFI